MKVAQYASFLSLVSPLAGTLSFRVLYSVQCRRVSQGAAANSCCFTVIGVGILASPTESHRALVLQTPTHTVYGKMPVQKLQLSRTVFRPHNLQFRNSNLSRLNPCNTTGITLHVSTNSQHVSFIMLSKSNHVATVVASFNLLVGVVLC